VLEIGKYNKLIAVKNVDFGVYLDGGSFGEILLPKKSVPENCKLGDEIEAFIYCDSEDRLIATTEKPIATVGEFAFLKAVSVSQAGAFMDWGLQKDLLVPFREQKNKIDVGKNYIVYIYFDSDSMRIAASEKIYKYIRKTKPLYEVGEEVDLLICSQTNMGYNAIINNSHIGIIYKNEIFEPLEIGMKIKAYIKKVRTDDKIDLSLAHLGLERINFAAEKIISLLNNNNGFIELTDKSPSDLISEKAGMSKKTFKKAVGFLYKNRIISIEGNGIQLIQISD